MKTPKTLFSVILKILYDTFEFKSFLVSMGGPNLAHYSYFKEMGTILGLTCSESFKRYVL